MAKFWCTLVCNVPQSIPFTHINSENPPLNLTKPAELHTYVAYNKPDIVILNETWLKENIGRKFFHSLITKFFRLDRSPYSHPLIKMTNVNLNLMAEASL